VVLPKLKGLAVGFSSVGFVSCAGCEPKLNNLLVAGFSSLAVVADAKLNAGICFWAGSSSFLGASFFAAIWNANGFTGAPLSC